MRNYLCICCGMIAFLYCSAVGASGEERKMGVMLPLTGEFARYGNAMQEGINAVAHPGQLLIYEDEGCNPSKAISAHRKLTSVDSVKIFLGPWCGSPQTVVAPLLPRYGQVAMLGSSAPAGVYQTSEGRMFSAQHSIEQESYFNAEKAYELGARRVVIVFFDNDFSRTHEQAFREKFAGEVLDTQAYTSRDLAALKAVALRIRQLNPDMVYVPDAFPLMHGFLAEMANAGLGKMPVMSVYTAQSADVLETAGKHGEGLIYSYPDIGEKEASEHFPALAAEILFSAVEACGDSDPECVRETLAKDSRFNSRGVLEGSLVLKTIRGGAFEIFSE